MATSYHQLGILAQARGDYEEAAPASTSAPSTSSSGSATRPGHGQIATASSASSPRPAGTMRKPPAEYQPSLDISERLGDQASIGLHVHRLAMLEADRGGPDTAVIAWHVKALAIRLGLVSRRLSATCAVWPLAAASLALSPSPACWPWLPGTPSWPTRSHPCSIKSTRPTTARSDWLLIRGLSGGSMRADRRAVQFPRGHHVLPTAKRFLCS